VKRQIHCI